MVQKRNYYFKNWGSNQVDPNSPVNQCNFEGQNQIKGNRIMFIAIFKWLVSYIGLLYLLKWDSYQHGYLNHSAQFNKPVYYIYFSSFVNVLIL